jgi:hypothetical protein
MIRPADIRAGRTLELTLPGVREWRIPAQVMTVAVTADNLEAVRADAAEHVERGGATLRELEAGR